MKLEHVCVGQQKDSNSQSSHELHPQPAGSDSTRKPCAIDDKSQEGSVNRGEPHGECSAGNSIRAKISSALNQAKKINTVNSPPGTVTGIAFR